MAKDNKVLVNCRLPAIVPVPKTKALQIVPQKRICAACHGVLYEWNLNSKYCEPCRVSVGNSEAAFSGKAS